MILFFEHFPATVMRSFPINLFIRFFLITTLAGLLNSCLSQPDLGFVNAAVDDLEETVPVPPTLEELRMQKSFISFLPIQYSQDLTRFHRVLSQAFVMSVLEEFGDLEITDEVLVEKALRKIEFRELKQLIEEEQFRRYDSPLIDAVIRLGKHLGVRYMGVMNVQTSPVNVAPNDWSTYITFRIMRVEDPPDSSYMTHEFTFIFSESNSLWEDIGAQIRGKFPLSGFVLETRANRSYARINLGRGNRIKSEQECKIFRRLRKESKDLKDKNVIVTDFDLLGRMTIFNVQQDFAWGRVAQESQGKILKGDAIRCY